jgi:DNA ligase (NAD+)
MLQKTLKVNDAQKYKSDGPLSHKNFMITGKLDGMSRAEAKSLTEKNSGSMVSTVSKKLNFLIVGDKPTKKKVDLARTLKVKIIDKAEWLKMLKN